MKTVKELEKDIDGIKERNRRVEADKAWETSGIRRAFIGVFTYVLVVILMMMLDVERPLFSAIIPSAAYLISTFSLGALKSWWLKRRN